MTLTDSLGPQPFFGQELLAEAARTEVENSASLKQLLAMEEETKRKVHGRDWMNGHSCFPPHSCS